jgi:hypothetical protein
MKVWKGWADDDGWVSPTAFEEGEIPVLVIDASEFPADYPEIGSEWLKADGHGGAMYTVEVTTPPVLGKADGLMYVGVLGFMTRNLPYWTLVADLHPIPTEATGEVVGTIEGLGATAAIEFRDVSGSLQVIGLREGVTYDIIRRPK